MTLMTRGLLATSLAPVTDLDLKTGRFASEYVWQARPNDNPKLVGPPDSDLLNRGQGYEVRDFINRFCEAHSLRAKDYQEAIETAIHQAYPGPFTHGQMKQRVATKLGLAMKPPSATNSMMAPALGLLAAQAAKKAQGSK